MQTPSDFVDEAAHVALDHFTGPQRVLRLVAALLRPWPASVTCQTLLAHTFRRR